jgi:hypothetical protein
MKNMQRDEWSKYGAELGAELNILFAAVSSLGVTPSPNTRLKKTSTGTILEFTNRDGAKATSSPTSEVTEQWFKLVKPETGKPLGYKLPEWYDSLGNPISPPSDSVTYGNRAGLKVIVFHQPWNAFAGVDYIQIDEVAALGLPCDKDGNLISGREEEYTWIAPPPIPLNCINPVLDDNGYNAQWINWLDDFEWGKPIYKYGDTIEDCTRANSAFNEHTNYSAGNTSSYLYYPCYNEIYGNGAVNTTDSGKQLILMYGWDYWRSLYIGSYNYGHSPVMNPNAPHNFRDESIQIAEHGEIIKAMKLPASIKFGSQNAATEVIECQWMDANTGGRVWTAINNPVGGESYATYDHLPDIKQYESIGLFEQSTSASPLGFMAMRYFLHSRNIASNFIRIE